MKARSKAFWELIIYFGLLKEIIWYNCIRSHLGFLKHLQVTNRTQVHTAGINHINWYNVVEMK